MAEIYGLFSGRDGRVRYGRTDNRSREERFKRHLRNPPNNLCATGFIENGKTVSRSSVRLECEDGIRRPVERWWMGRFSGLLNEQMSGQIWLNGLCSKPFRIPQITAYMRRKAFFGRALHLPLARTGGAGFISLPGHLEPSALEPLVGRDRRSMTS